MAGWQQQGSRSVSFARITHLERQDAQALPRGRPAGTGHREPGHGLPLLLRPQQVPTAQVIRRLRDLEMPGSQVKEVLDAPDAPARNALIAAHLGLLRPNSPRPEPRSNRYASCCSRRGTHR